MTRPTLRIQFSPSGERYIARLEHEDESAPVMPVCKHCHEPLNTYEEELAEMCEDCEPPEQP